MPVRLQGDSLAWLLAADRMHREDGSSQRDRATAIVEDAAARAGPALLALQRDLGTILDLAQNRPPDGSADGTIGEARYDVLRKLYESTTDVIYALANAQRFDSR